VRLADALGVRAGEVVALTGAGGKTTTLFRLADELAARGLRVVTTTTTRLAQREVDSLPHALALGFPPELPAGFGALLDAHRHVFVYSRPVEGGKVRGLDAAWLDAFLVPHPAVDAVLIEADGARRLPLKAPYPHEPVIPASATLVVPVAGLDALGAPLDAAHVYGADVITGQTGHRPGAPVTPALMAAVLGSPAMGLKGMPPGARAAVLLNKAADANRVDARTIARTLLGGPSISRVVISAAVDASSPALEVRRRVPAVVLAAGESKRMGQPKLLLPWGDGSTIIRRVCETVLTADLVDTVVVTGARRGAVEAELADLPLRLVHNPQYAEGEMLSSVLAGLDALHADDAACLVVLGDQPALGPGIIHRLLDAYAGGAGRIVAPEYMGRRGHPVLIDRAYWGALRALPPGGAPRDVLRAHPDDVATIPVDAEAVIFDIDTPEDYAQARGARESTYNKGDDHSARRGKGEGDG
jgi:molybdenum cofactor cytidylyltransferase